MYRLAYAAVISCAFSVSSFAQGNEVSVKQLGTDNVQQIDQGVGIATAEDNSAKLYQSGNKNSGVIAQGSNTSGVDIEATALNNSSDIIQKGNENQAVTSQGVGFISSAKGNSSTIKQRGNRNQATTQQGVVEGGAVSSTIGILQDGRDHQTTVTQGSSSFDASSTRDEVDVVQRGYEHQASVIQGTSGPSTGNEVFIRQSGNQSRIAVQQATIVSGNAERNTVAVTQLGYAHNAEVRQGIEGLAQDNVASVLQNGSSLTAYHRSRI